MANKLPEKFAYWHGIDRTKIPWFPEIDEEKCIGCKLCFVTCGRQVFDFDTAKNKAVVARKYQCLVGCTTCAAICPASAIKFPDKEIVHKIEKEEKVLVKIQQKAKAKIAKMDFEKQRKNILDKLATSKTKIAYEITGHIFEKNLIPKIKNEISDCKVDLSEISMEIPSLKGCWDMEAPSLLKFNLVSTEMEDISECARKVEKIIEDSKCVIISKKS